MIIKAGIKNQIPVNPIFSVCMGIVLGAWSLVELYRVHLVSVVLAWPELCGDEITRYNSPGHLVNSYFQSQIQV